MKKLFNGEPTTQTTITLSENIDNYKFILIGTGVPWDTNDIPSNFIIPTQELLKYGSYVYTGSDGAVARRIKITATSNTLTKTGGDSSSKIFYVYGFN